MAWVDKPGICEVCGKAIILKSSRQKYCSECAPEMYRIQRIRNSAERNRRERMFRQGKDPDRWKGKDHECHVIGSCIYGGEKSCNYLSTEGHSRLLAGYPIKGGRCDLYQRGPKKKPSKTTLPSAPVLKSGALKET